jgi:hypothetical protein
MGQCNGSNGFISSIHELKSDLDKLSCPAVTRRGVTATPSGVGNLISTLLLKIIRLSLLLKSYYNFCCFKATGTKSDTTSNPHDMTMTLFLFTRFKKNPGEK